MKTRVALVGIGATGLEVGRLLAERSDATVVAAIDRDPAKVGRPLSEVLSTEASDVVVGDDIAALSSDDVDVAVVTVTSHMDVITPLLSGLARAGINAVSLCEELSYPWVHHPDQATILDDEARANGVSIVSTGCNPGFLLDTLPIVLSSAMQRVDRIDARRRCVLTGYGPLLDKFGLGLSPADFEAALGDTVIGHVGFHQSLAHVCARMGWNLDRTEVDLPRAIVIADAPRKGAYVDVPAGTVAGVEHCARAICDGEVVVEYVGYFGFFEDGDDVPHGDEWRLTGDGRELVFGSDAGVDSWETTIAELVNLIEPTAAARPGLLTTTDLPVAALAAKGARARAVAA
jgi:4-hydroxy-tetrahydrodipicolinate reductase